MSLSLSDAVREYVAAKVREVEAIEARRAAAAKIAQLLPGPLGESVSVALPADAIAKRVRVSRDENIKVTDYVALGDLLDAACRFDVLESKPRLNESALQEMKEQEPDLYVKASEFLVKTPAAIQITIS